MQVAAGGTAEATATVPLANPELWSIPRPYLYTLTATTVLGGPQTAVDAVNISVGIYDGEWSADHGFAMNDRHIKIRGFCDHNDFGGVGMAVPDRIKLYRAQLLRSVGGNGRRMYVHVCACACDTCCCCAPRAPESRPPKKNRGEKGGLLMLFRCCFDVVPIAR